MEGHQTYSHVIRMIPHLSEDAQKRITSIRKEARFVEKIPTKQFCCPKCGHTNNPNHIPCCYMDKRRDGSRCLHWTIKTGAVHSIIPSSKVFFREMITRRLPYSYLQFQIIVAFFKNKKGKRGIVIDPLVIEKQFKSYEGRYSTNYLRFDGRSIRNHSAYTCFDTTGPLQENEKSLEENYIELHDDNKNVQVGG